MTWIFTLISLSVQYGPAFVKMIEAVIEAIKKHPAGPQAGIAAVNEHASKICEGVACPSDLK